MILLGILTTTVLPLFSSREGFAEYAVRDQLISAFRYAQQHAMYDHSGNCYRLNIDVAGFGPQQAGSYFGPVGRVELSGDFAGLSIAPAAPIYFDGLGNTYTNDCAVGPIAQPTPADPLVITVNPGGVSLEVFSSGYIRGI